MTTSRYLTVFLGLLTVAGCAAPEESSETLRASNGGPRQALSEIDSDHYVVLRKEDDGVLQVARAGFKQTRCADGVWRSACPVTKVDLSRVGMSPDEEVFARARIADGSAVVVAKLGFSADAERERVLFATRIWTRDVAAPTRRSMPLGSDPLYVLRDVHQGCAGDVTECKWLRIEPTNGDLPRHYKLLDLKPTGSCLSDEQRGALQDGTLLAQGAGIGTVFVVASLLSVFPRPLPTDHLASKHPGVLEPQ